MSYGFKVTVKDGKAIAKHTSDVNAEPGNVGSSVPDGEYAISGHEGPDWASIGVYKSGGNEPMRQASASIYFTPPKTDTTQPDSTGS